MKLKEIWQKISYREGENISEQMPNYDSSDEGNTQARIDLFKNIINGNWLDWEFFRRQRILVVLIAALFFIYTDNRYRCEKERSYLAQLQKDVIDKRYEDLEVSAQLVEMSRQSHVIERLKAYDSRLQESSTPAIKIND